MAHLLRLMNLSGRGLASLGSLELPLHIVNHAFLLVTFEINDQVVSHQIELRRVVIDRVCFQIFLILHGLTDLLPVGIVNLGNLFILQTKPFWNYFQIVLIFRVQTLLLAANS